MSNQAWKNFKQNMKDKRMGKGRKKERSAFLKSGELVVSVSVREGTKVLASRTKRVCFFPV